MPVLGFGDTAVGWCVDVDVAVGTGCSVGLVFDGGGVPTSVAVAGGGGGASSDS